MVKEVKMIMNKHGMHCGGSAGKIKRTINFFDQLAHIQIAI